MKTFNFMGFILFASTLLPSTALATTINIPADYPTIQQGIDASSNGDTVLVNPGTYGENVNFNGHNIVLGSLFLTTEDTSYISTTIIDGDSSGSVVRFENGEDSGTVIAGFTIMHGRTSPYGGGIYCVSNSNPVIRNNIIRDNFGFSTGGSPLGGGIYIGDSGPLIMENLITNNEVHGDPGAGAGICGMNSASVIIGNVIADNTAYGVFGGMGGGIFFGASSPVISGNIVVYNTTTEPGIGGGLLFGECTALLSANTIFGNTSHWGSAIYSESSDLDITNTIIWGNGADSNIVYQGTIPILNYCDIQGGWAGTGNIDCDPQFCDPENGDFYLDAESCCFGAGQGGANIGAFGAGCGLPCDDFYIPGDFNGSGQFNVADIISSYSRLATGSPNPALQCECPPGSGLELAVAMDVNNTCVFNVADVVVAYHRLAFGEPEFQPCQYCPPAGR